MSAKKSSAYSSGFFLIGLGIIFLVDTISFWPWILMLLAITSFIGTFFRSNNYKKNFFEALIPFIWLAGLALIFYSGYFLAGILILIGFSTLIGIAVDKQKRK